MTQHRFRHHPLLGTMVEIRVDGVGEAAAASIESVVVAEMTRLERILSIYDPDSELSRWRSGQLGPAGPELSVCLAEALDWQRRSGGAFNTAAGVLVARWRRAEREGVVPGSEELSEIARSVAEPRYRIDEDGRARLTGEGGGIDLNAFAKGWIVDRASEAGLTILRDHVGEEAGALYVNAGGDIRREGDGVQVLGIENPLRPYDNEPPVQSVNLRSGGVATSGRARRGFRVAGRWFGHVLDAASAATLDRVASISVMAADAAGADALATVLGALPPGTAIEEADRYGVGCLVITADGTLHANQRWQRIRVSG